MNLLENRLQFRNFLGGAAVDSDHAKRIGLQLKQLLFVIILIVVYAGFTVATADAAVYFIDKNSGNDSANGSAGSAWKTIAKANNTLKPGDTVIIKKGTYSEGINPQNSGSNGNPITYKSDTDGVLIVGSGNNYPVLIRKNYITIDGLSIKRANLPSGNSANILIYGNNNKIVNCNIINTKDGITQGLSGIHETGIIITKGSYNQIENCLIKNLSFNGIKLNTANHTIIRNNEIADTYANSISITTSYSDYAGILIEKNRLIGSFTSDGIQFNGNYKSNDFKHDQSNKGAIIRGNIIFNHAENTIDLKGTKHILIDTNILYGGIGDNDGAADNRDDRFGGAGAIATGSNATSSDVIIRGNLMYDNNGAILLCNGYKVYNNTILGNNRDYTGSNSNFSPNGVPMFVGISAGSAIQKGAIKNNIIAGHNVAEISIRTSSAQIDIDYNLYYNDGQSTFVDFQGKSNWTRNTLDQWKNLLLSRSNISGNDQNSIEGDPHFVSKLSLKPTGALNMQSIGLNSNSIAINKGGPLTTTTNGGSGNIIYVKDAGYFCDGYGASDGDLIKVGTNAVVKVMSIDYSKNMIVVSRKMSWNNGDDVTLKYNGAEPDIGAAEYLNSVIPSPSLRIVVSNDK
jgi:hypothetical protein